MKEIIRKAILQKIYSRLNVDRPQSIAIVGDYKIGKTTLIKQILNPKINKNYLSNKENYHFLYIDPEKEKLSFEGLLDIMIESILPNRSCLLNAESKYTTLHNIISENIHMNYVFIFDNFSYLTQNKETPLEFFSFLRSLANSYNVAYITSSRIALQKICVTKEIEESPFFNIFTNIELKFFNDLEMNEFCVLNNCLKHKKCIISLCGGHPYIISLVYEIMDQINLETCRIDNFSKSKYKNIYNKMIELIRNLPDELQKTIIKIVKRKRINNREKYLYELLQRKGYISENYELSSEVLFECSKIYFKKKTFFLLSNLWRLNE